MNCIASCKFVNIVKGIRLTWENEENPGCHFASGSQTAEVELPNGHGDGVLHGVDDVVEVPQFCTEHEVEEAAEWSEDYDKLHHEGWETNEAKFNGGCNLFEGFLETEMNKIECSDALFSPCLCLRSLQSLSMDVKTVKDTVYS